MRFKYLLLHLKLKTYCLIRPLLFLVDPEKIHHISLTSLVIFAKIFKRSATRYHPKTSIRTPYILSNTTKKLLETIDLNKNHSKGTRLMGLTFPNRIGLAAGLDKDGKYLNGLAMLGCGFIEIGTVTPKAQPGNPRPRLIRLPEFNALINKMGFNNSGLNTLIKNVKETTFQGILGINIGKNADTPIQIASNDYLIGLEQVYPIADYIAINISSPNTQHLRELQQQKQLIHLIETLQEKRQKLSYQLNKLKPLAIKLSPDLSEEEIEMITEITNTYEIEAIISCNTTTNRNAIKTSPFAKDSGGLSGRPNFERSLEMVKKLRKLVSQKTVLIGVGGIFSGNQAKQMIDAGADLIQLYTGLIYRGPGLIDECIIHTIN